MATLGSARRYYLSKRHSAHDSGDFALSDAWRGKQEAEAGDALPSDFPYLSRLQGRGYSTLQDLDGADADELTSQGFTSREAAEILAEAE